MEPDPTKRRSRSPQQFYVYVLQNESGRRYVGTTGHSPQARLAGHNAGASRWTRPHRPWHLLHSEFYPTKRQALHRERFLKSGAGRRLIDHLTSPHNMHGTANSAG